MNANANCIFCGGGECDYTDRPLNFHGKCHHDACLAIRSRMATYWTTFAAPPGWRGLVFESWGHQHEYDAPDRTSNRVTSTWEDLTENGDWIVSVIRERDGVITNRPALRFRVSPDRINYIDEIGASSPWTGDDTETIAESWGLR